MYTISNLDNLIDEIYILIFKPNYVPEDRSSERLLESKGKKYSNLFDI